MAAAITTMQRNAPSKSWIGGATMADASLNRRMTVRLGDAVAFAQIGSVALDGQIELEALRLYGLPEAAPALLCGTPNAAGWASRTSPSRPRSTCRRSRPARCTSSTWAVAGARQAG